MALLTRDDIPRLPSKAPTARMAYDLDPNQFAELRVPNAEGRVPVVAIFHGGCWAEFADAFYTGPLATALTRHGWATWNIEYRRVHQPGGGWPGTFLDSAQGLDFLREAAKNHPLDLSRVVAIGHSAGGQLALWCAARGGLPESSEVTLADPLPLRGAVSIGGLPDLAVFAANPGPCEDRLARLMGGPPNKVPKRYALVSPARRLPLGVPQVLIWGELDTIASHAAFSGYERAAQAAGDSVTSIVIPNAGHHELMSPELPAYKVLVEQIGRLLA